MYNEKIIYNFMYVYFNFKISIKEIERRTNAHISTVYRWIEKYKKVNWLDINQSLIDFEKIYKIKKSVFFKKCNDEIYDYIKSYVSQNKFINVPLVIKKIKTNLKIKVKKSTIYAILKKLNFTRKRVKIKKVSKKKLPLHNQEVEKFIKNINEEIKNGKDIWALDESSFNINMTDLYGWSPKNTPCIHNPDNNCRDRYTLLLMISNKKGIAFKIRKGSINGESFLHFLDKLQIPENTKILLDNASIHKTKEAQNRQYYNNFIFNVPYNPETNPIEMVFSKIKSYVRKRDNSTEKKLLKNIKLAIKKIKSQDLENYFKKSFSDFNK